MFRPYLEESLVRIRFLKFKAQILRLDTLRLASIESLIDSMPIAKTGLTVIGEETSYYLILERGLSLAGPR